MSCGAATDEHFDHWPVLVQQGGIRGRYNVLRGCPGIVIRFVTGTLVGGCESIDVAACDLPCGDATICDRNRFRKRPNLSSA
jgi:1,4-dihydroxy-2-naphthoyl-CoA synthase